MELSNKNPTNNDKSLCLYCDKTFSNNIEQENHVERDHKTILCKGRGSRKSERITKNNSSSENSPFPGCFHCNKRSSRTDDLDVLFKHLLTSHKDIYFGCKCKVRTQDKLALASHKKNCKLGGGGQSARCSGENVSVARKTAKKAPVVKNNGDSRCDSKSESEDNASTEAATLPTNAIHKKSDRGRMRNRSKSSSGHEKMRSNKNSSSSSTTSSGSSIKTGEDEYTIPLTRQKLKEPPIFSRLGATQNRNIASNKKSQKINKTTATIEVKSITSSSPSTKVQRTKTNKVLNANLFNNPEPIESAQKNEIINIEFEEDFYKNISSNVRINLNCYVDGKSDRLLNRPVFDHIAEQSEICSTINKQVANVAHEKEIHEATMFELSTPFPALLTAGQYGFGDSNPNKHKRQITKNSWKWKWDLIKKYKYVNEGGKIVKKVKQSTTGLKDLSQLDMWTQLSMRSRYENLYNENESTVTFDDGLTDSLSSRIIKTQNIEQLNCILDKRLTPEIDIEQLQQTVVKLEPEEKKEISESFGIEKENNETERTESELLNMFNLVKTKITCPSKPLLSGEWARPRCYICIDCGQKFDLMKSLNDHKNSEHPYVVSAHYEIVGRENLEHKLYKNLFLPKKALQTIGFARSLSVNSDSKSNETNEASTSSDNSSKFFADQKEIECSKCLKMIKYSSDNDIYRHILDCIEDRTWMQAKRRSKYRRTRRRNRKNTRKLRLSIDQKKIISSPSVKDNTEGENSTLSLSNPPTPKTDAKSSTIVLPTKISKYEPSINEAKTVNGKSNEGMNIKNFFRVSKTTPALKQKLVVQMMEIPPSNPTKSLKSSLRSSSVKRAANRVVISKSGSVSKNEIPKKDDKKKLVTENNFKSCSEELKIFDMNKSGITHEMLEEVKQIPQSFEGPLIPLIITTSHKTSNEFPLSSPSNPSLISPTSNSNVPKKKKKLNDCIAMLTCKIQEKLGVSFFESPQEDSKSLEKIKPIDSNSILHQDPEIMESKPTTSCALEFLLKQSSFHLPVQDEVIDLSFKKKPAKIEQPDFERIEPRDSPTRDIKAPRNISENKTTPIELEQAAVGISSVPIPFEFKLKAADYIMPNVEKMLQRSLKNHIFEDEPVNAQEVSKTIKNNDIENIIEEDEAQRVIETVGEICAESFKISIPKEKIPNLKEILDQYQIVTVNNIKISESERRAFEEQKNRILQILNKTNSLTRKITSKKIIQKKNVKRKAPVRKPTARKNTTKKLEVAKPRAVAPTEAQTVEAKIEEVIKTTNRIRCRRLSVVVDPIINLTTFQTKNRKIRLTNNSQQNGFYELLAGNEQFFPKTKSSDETPKVETIVKPSHLDEAKSYVKNKTLTIQEPEIVETGMREVIEVFNLVTKTRAAKSNGKEAKALATRASKELTAKNPECQPSIKSEAKAADDKATNKPTKITNSEEEKILESLIETLKDSTKSTPKKLKVQKQKNAENILTPAPTVELKYSLEYENKFENNIKLKSEEKPKATPEKKNVKNCTKFFSPLEEIKVGQSADDMNVNEMPVRKGKVTRRKHHANEVNLLDLSFSSDTSNENNIPLAKLIIPTVNPVLVEIAPIHIDDTKFDDSVIATTEIESKIKPTSRKSNRVINKHEPQYENLIIAQTPEVNKVMIISSNETLASKVVYENQIYPLKVTDDSKFKEFEKRKIVKTLKPEGLENEQIKKLQPFLCKTSSTVDLSSTSDVDTRKSFDPFTINEDSFFNDDLDNDPSDKINDIVNNIINSSEFQIDSETEKSEAYEPNDDQSVEKIQKTSCAICKRTFRNEKVLEKHFLSSTHIMKVQRKHRGIARIQERFSANNYNEPAIVKEKPPSPIFDETKIFRTKGALKTFETILNVPVSINNENIKAFEDLKSNPVIVAHQHQELSREQKLLNANEDKLYYEFKMEKKPEDMTPKDKDQLFDSLFNSLEAKAHEKQISYTPTSNFLAMAPQDSEVESSNTSWDLKHEADLEWEVDNPENVSFANAIKERYPKKYPVKINKSKDTAVSIPTKSLIMGKIFKKHRDREKQKTPQADAPNNKPGIKNSLDEIFDHLKNSAEIDDKVLTCPSPKTLLKNAGETFSPISSNSNDMLETASQSNNNNYVSETARTSPKQNDKKTLVDSQILLESLTEDGTGKRKSRRRCAIKAKTFAETWSSDEYEELHDTTDIISIINEIEKRESKKRKSAKTDNHLECNKKEDTTVISVKITTKPCSTVKIFESLLEEKSVQTFDLLPRKKFEKKTSVEDTPKPEKTSNSIKKGRISAAKDGHRSDDETFTATKGFRPLKPYSSIRKRRMSCFVPSTTSFEDKPKFKPTVAKPIKEILSIETETFRTFERANENHELKAKSVKRADSEKSYKNQKKFANLLHNFSGPQQLKKKLQKHRKRPRNKVKNIAYDSDSDFEVNLNKKSKAPTFSGSSSSEVEEEEEDNEIHTAKAGKSQTITNESKSRNTVDMTMIKEPKLLPNDLKHVVDSTTTFKDAIPFEDILDSPQSACNRTKRHSSEKLYYWSSSSSDSDQEQGDTADGYNEDSVVPHQPEQHGWIVGDSHKKLVTLLAHAKIKNKIN